MQRILKSIGELITPGTLALSVVEERSVMWQIHRSQTLYARALCSNNILINVLYGLTLWLLSFYPVISILNR